ncbi:hypothetical protein [Mycetocola sp.]|uniref:hypothetical protein n=1 Tax=Mycetocola sp. TaxID=1871042 RepID=UPI003989AE39
MGITAGCLAALAILGDQAADRYENKASTLTFKESEVTAEKAVDDLNVVLSEAIEVMFLAGAAKAEAIRALRRTVARQAASSIGEGSRATYYSLKRESGGLRILGQPKHGKEAGRYDVPDRPFIEKEDRAHPIWELMDRADEEPEVHSYPEEVYGVDWTTKKYTTFYSVPVKANTVQLGMLSVNNSQVGSIGGAQRAVLLAMARTMALVIASHKGPRLLNTQATYSAMSAAPTTVSDIGQRSSK